MNREELFENYQKANQNKMAFINIGNLVIFSIILAPFFLQTMDASTSIIHFFTKVSTFFAYAIVIFVAYMIYHLTKVYKDENLFKQHIQQSVTIKTPLQTKSQIAFDFFIGVLFSVTLYSMNFPVLAFIYLICEILFLNIKINNYTRSRETLKDILENK